MARHGWVPQHSPFGADRASRLGRGASVAIAMLIHISRQLTAWEYITLLRNAIANFNLKLVVSDNSDDRVYLWDGSDRLSPADTAPTTKVLQEIPAKKMLKQKD